MYLGLHQKFSWRTESRQNRI